MYILPHSTELHGGKGKYCTNSEKFLTSNSTPLFTSSGNKFGAASLTLIRSGALVYFNFGTIEREDHN